MTVTSYANGTDFLARYDARLIGDLVRDDGTRENPATLPTNTNLLTALVLPGKLWVKVVYLRRSHSKPGGHGTSCGNMFADSIR